MPHTKQAAKDLRKSTKRKLINHKIKSAIKNAVKKCRIAIIAKDTNAEKMMRDAQKMLDKAVKKGILKKNTASRGKARLAARLNKAKV